MKAQLNTAFKEGKDQGFKTKENGKEAGQKVTLKKYS